MSILDKLQSDMEDDAYFNLPLQERYDNMKRDAETIAARLDALVAMLEQKKPKPQHDDFHPFDIDQWNEAVCQWQRKADIHARAVAIAEGRES